VIALNNPNPNIRTKFVDIDEELHAYFTEWQNASECVKRTTLMQILKVNVIYWCERRLIRKFYMDQRVKLKLDQWRQEE